MPKRESLSNLSADTPSDKTNQRTLPVTNRFLSSSNSSSSDGDKLRTVEHLVDPQDCKPWKFHNRDEAWMNPDKCKDLISSIRKNGQKFPVVARKLKDDPDGKTWEIIAGRRRWFACNHIGEKLKLKSIDASDRECAILMNLENKDRDDVSEFEDAISYRQQLDARLFDSQDDMAAALDLNKSKLSKMLAAAKITNHKDIIKLFDDITTLKVNPAYQLVILLEKSETNREVINQKAKNLFKSFTDSTHKLGTPTIINKLLQSVENSIKTSKAEPKLYKHNEKTILRAQELSNGRLSFEFNKRNIAQIDKDLLVKITLEALEEYA